MNIIQLLQRTELFYEMSPQSIEAVAQRCIKKGLHKKEILFLEGEPGHAVFICIRGDIQLHKTTHDGREIVIKLIQPGEMFAEVILFEKKYYPVSAIALSKSQLLMVTKQHFNELLQLEDFRNDFICMLMRKQRYLANQIKYLTTHDVEERLFRFLEEHYGRIEKISLTLSKKDVAAAIGTIPETLSRILLRLKQERKLFWEGKLVRVTEWEKGKSVQAVD